MFIDNDPLILWLTECVTLSQLRRAIHADYKTILKILEKEEVPVYRFSHGRRYRHYVTRYYARKIIFRHGSEFARQRRLANKAVKRKGLPLKTTCPHCGKRGRQWRSGLNSAGHPEVVCGHCKRLYTLGKRPPLQTTCLHCGANTHQWRGRLTSAGNFTIKCGHCKRYYTVPGNPDAALAKSTAPWWARQRRPALEHIEAPDRCEW